MTNPVIECLLNHRSVRRFKQKPVEIEVQELILKAGTRAATAGNLQLYSFIVVDDERQKQAMSLPHAPLIIVSVVDLHRLRRWFALRETAHVCMHRPVSFFIGLWDAIIALHNVVVAAESLGLGGYYIGRIVSTDIQKLFEAPEHVFPAGMVALGYPDESPELSVRLPLEAVVHRNRYHRPTDEQIGQYYAERERVWDKVPGQRKAELAEQSIFSIPQAVVAQKFSDTVTSERSKGILDNLRRSGFCLTSET